MSDLTDILKRLPNKYSDDVYNELKEDIRDLLPETMIDAEENPELHPLWYLYNVNLNDAIAGYNQALKDVKKALK